MIDSLFWIKDQPPQAKYMTAVNRYFVDNMGLEKEAISKVEECLSHLGSLASVDNKLTLRALVNF